MKTNLIPFNKGEILTRNCIFVDGDKQFKPDNKGYILGIKVVGTEVLKEGRFFKENP